MSTQDQDAQVAAVQLDTSESDTAPPASDEQPNGCYACVGFKDIWDDHKAIFITVGLWLILALAATVEAAVVPKTSTANLINWGLIPRVPRGLVGIVTAPFIHASTTPFHAHSLRISSTFLFSQYHLFRAF